MSDWATFQMTLSAKAKRHQADSLQIDLLGWVSDWLSTWEQPCEWEAILECFNSHLTRGDVGSPPRGWNDPWLIGLLHERLPSDSQRRGRGAWYSPEPLVRGLVDVAMGVSSSFDLVLDPTCGGGAFLLAAADALVVRGVSPADALAMLRGADIDETAVSATNESLRCWAQTHGVSIDPGKPPAIVADALGELPADWSQIRLVIGNPPFGTPLRKRTLGGQAESSYRQNRKAVIGPYTDTAAVHLLKAVEDSDPGSVVCMIQPQSVVSSRDVGSITDEVNSRGSVIGFWATDEALFDASVKTVAPIIGIGSDTKKVAIYRGSGVTAVKVSNHQQPWNELAAAALGFQTIKISSNGVLGDIAAATAGFRDEYYGVAKACVESSDYGSDEQRILTVGGIDPLWAAWGSADIRFNKRRWAAPVIDRALCDKKTLSWCDSNEKPKILLATQARVLEPFVDTKAQYVPVTPVISVWQTAEKSLAHIAAVLLAPPVVYSAWIRTFGSALSVEAIKLSAKNVLELPLPFDESLWNQAAGLVAESEPKHKAEALAVSAKVAHIMTEAYRSSMEVFQWWSDRAAIAGSEANPL